MDLTRFIVLLSILVFLFGLYKAADAAEIPPVSFSYSVESLKLEQNIVSPDSGFTLTVPPDISSDVFIAEVGPVADHAELPADKQALSKVYYYSLKLADKGLLHLPVKLALTTEEAATVSRKSIYYYNKTEQKWLRLPGKVNRDGSVEALSIFPSAAIVAFDDSSELTADSAIVVDNKTGEVIFEKNTGDLRSLASLTKLMTALVFLENNPGWDKTVTFKKSDFVGGAALNAPAGEKFTTKQLFYCMLVGSKNNCAEALARSTGKSRAEFVSLMNAKAKIFGLARTRFVEPAGVSAQNVSTAAEMAVIAREAFKKNDIYKASTTKKFSLYAGTTGNEYNVVSTSAALLDRDLNITGTKTGHIDGSGYNLVTQARTGSRELIALVLGADENKNVEEVYKLLKKYL